MTGVRIALDDFGAGYSSLGQLRNLPVDILKIDQSLVAEPESSRTGTAAPLVDVVVRLGHRLGLEVIAEGMEEPQQLTVVEAAGCRWGQGWLFGAAVPAEHLEARLAAVSASALRPRPTGVPDARPAAGGPAAGGPAAGGPAGVPVPALPQVPPQTPAGPTLPAQTVRSVDSGREMRQA
jgi:predicted signal transduction protein with EAL and GGDEF domain